jgi:stage II sporulation protein D
MESLWGDDFPDYYNRLMKIVSNTSLEVITCDGVLIAPYYHSVSSGYTRLGTEVLGDDFSYLCQANCPDDKASSVFFKAYYYDYDEFASIVRTLDNAIVIDDNEPLKNVQIVSRDSSGYVLDMTIGNITVSGTAFYEAMNINSPSFMIEDYNGCVRITTYGVGHGLGVSLCYASELAKNGASYIEILNYFYTNIVISAL